MKVKANGYLINYLYVSPDDTLAEGERPHVQALSGYFKTLDAALDFILDNFDGQETWQETYVPEIKEHFENCDDEFIVDDWSAGQWVTIIPHFSKDITIELGDFCHDKQEGL